MAIVVELDLWFGSVLWTFLNLAFGAFLFWFEFGYSGALKISEVLCFGIELLIWLA